MSNKCLYFCFSFTKSDDCNLSTVVPPENWGSWRRLERHLKSLLWNKVDWPQEESCVLSCQLKLQEHHHPPPGKTGRGYAREGEDRGHVAAVNLVKVWSQHSAVSGPFIWPELLLHFQGDQEPLSYVQSWILTAQAALHKHNQRSLSCPPILHHHHWGILIQCSKDQKLQCICRGLLSLSLPLRWSGSSQSWREYRETGT